KQEHSNYCRYLCFHKLLSVTERARSRDSFGSISKIIGHDEEGTVVSRTPTFDFFILSSSRASPHARQVTGQPAGGGIFAPALFGPAVIKRNWLKILAS